MIGTTNGWPAGGNTRTTTTDGWPSSAYTGRTRDHVAEQLRLDPGRAIALELAEHADAITRLLGRINTDLDGPDVRVTPTLIGSLMDAHGAIGEFLDR